MDSNEAKIDRLVKKSLQNKADEHVQNYVTGVIVDDPTRSLPLLYAVLADLLIAYEIVATAEKAQEWCIQTLAALKENGFAVKPSSEWSDVQEGLQCSALYAADHQWYPATVLKKGPNQTVLVRYTGYGTEAQLPFAAIRLHQDGVAAASHGHHSRLLSAPVSIATMDKVRVEKKKKKDKKIINAASLAKKEKIKAERERKRAEFLRMKEELRKRKAEERKQKALQIFLSSDREVRNMDVNIVNYSMSTLDGSQELLHDADLKFVSGRRYGLIGRNGVGKSTLLQCIAHYEPDGFPTHLRVSHVEQEVLGTTTSVLDTVLQSDLELQLLQDEDKKAQAQIKIEEAKSPHNDALLKDLTERLGLLHGRLDEVEAWSAEARASTILAGLGFPFDKQQVATKELSGGWRMRVALAAALFTRPDLLLLDEPTNHLDFPAVLWLEDYLRKYPNTIILVSHDRQFVNNVITDVIHFYHKQLWYYRGDYDTFEKTRTEQMKAQKRAFEAQAAKRAHVQKFIDKFRYNAKRASLVQSRLKALNRMEALADVLEDPTWQFAFPEPDEVRGTLVQCSAVSFGYDPKNILLEKVDVNVDMDSRIGIVGANGVGKSTLIKLLTGELEPTAGQITRNHQARIAVFAQHHMDQLDLTLTPVQQLMALFPGYESIFMRAHLGRFGITDNLGLQKIRTLSGGQKSRVAFAIVTFKLPNLIIMDEPTNHLDLETIEALIMAVNTFSGGVVVVSHDQHFLLSICDEYWGAADRRISIFPDFTAAKKFCYKN